MKTKKKEKNSYGPFQIISNFLSTFVVTVVAIVAVILVALRITGLEAFNIESGSMSPEYPVNSLIIVKEVEPSEIAVGDVITYVFNKDGLLITHRVIDIDTGNESFTTKGDTNNTPDPNPVLWGNVVGKVVFSLPKLGAPLEALTAEKNRTTVIIIIAVLGILSLSWDLIDKKFLKSKEQEHRDENTNKQAENSDNKTVMEKSCESNR